MKKSSIHWHPKALKEYEALTDEHIIKSVNKAIEKLEENPFSGDLIPRKYTKKAEKEYGTNKLFRLELTSYWRLIYTVIGEETTIIALILEFMPHKKYERRFGY